jgi:hypothetical protein
MLILKLGFLFLLFWFQMWLPFPHLSYKVYIGQGIVQSLIVRFMGAMWPTLPNTTWYGICKRNIMWLWSCASLDNHLFRRRAQGNKITWPWMCGSWATLWPDSIAMSKKQLLGLGRHTNLEWNRLQVTLQDT